MKTKPKSIPPLVVAQAFEAITEARQMLEILVSHGVVLGDRRVAAYSLIEKLHAIEAVAKPTTDNH